MHLKTPRPGLSTIGEVEVLCTTQSLRPRVPAKRVRNSDAPDPDPHANRKRVKYSPVLPPPTEKKLPFLSLPRDLGDKIHDYALEGLTTRYHDDRILRHHKTTIIATYTPVKETLQNEQLESLEWLRFNKQLQQEALTQYYRHGEFTIKALGCHRVQRRVLAPP
jgi:hypothetical protein